MLGSMQAAMADAQKVQSLRKELQEAVVNRPSDSYNIRVDPGEHNNYVATATCNGQELKVFRANREDALEAIAVLIGVAAAKAHYLETLEG